MIHGTGKNGMRTEPTSHKSGVASAQTHTHRTHTPSEVSRGKQKQPGRSGAYDSDSGQSDTSVSSASSMYSVAEERAEGRGKRLYVHNKLREGPTYPPHTEHGIYNQTNGTFYARFADAEVAEWRAHQQQWKQVQNAAVRNMVLEAVPLLVQGAGKLVPPPVGPVLYAAGVGLSGVKGLHNAADEAYKAYRGEEYNLAKGLGAAIEAVGAAAYGVGNGPTLSTSAANALQGAGATAMGLGSAMQSAAPLLHSRPPGTFLTPSSYTAPADRYDMRSYPVRHPQGTADGVRTEATATQAARHRPAQGAPSSSSRTTNSRTR
ncbi:hypothetical protein [Streptomyces thermoviolaceus]|uniref:Uncharacterized protein n=1 Tax=Streptomyces thermoviolaceus subsp. thermoviolaceus TaxID=66860 RepID=A0ABX0YVF2_STRTL|nr:hypothetical protein [Streptomyces thermoviolaceus]NJP15061.1 hypothetical protein [Streptomyces thermoviolaceus subsp. thermoviolaceus]WTD47927.1 hypothetical protein OG899_10540 [Streptomyces thermoviolaceus]